MNRPGKLDFERAVLRLIAEGRGEWSWHNVAVELSAMGMAELDLMAVFADLLRRGFVVEIPAPGHPHPLWGITEAGRVELEKELSRDG